MADEDILRSLQTKIGERGPHVRRHDGYYAGALRLAALGLSLPPEMRSLQTVVNWPRLVVDALAERIKLTGFRMRGSLIGDERLWSWWQRNNLDEEFPLGVLEMLVQGRGYVVGGYNDDRPDTPLITMESARNMAVEVDYRTRQVKAAARLYDHAPGGLPRAATLYLPGRNLYYDSNESGKWTLTETVDTGLERVPVIPMVNRARLHDRDGTSEMTDVMPLTDAACRNLTNLQAAQEFLALPARFVFGIDESEMVDENGDPVPAWQAYIGRFNTLRDPEAKVVQLPAADLRNFIEVNNHYASLVSSVTGLPAHYLGQTSENPASADAIRSAEARHVKRAEDKCRVVGGVAEEVMRLGMEIVDGEVPDEALQMEALFADPATPTYAQQVDAVVKLYGNGSGLLPREAAWEELGWGPEKIARYKQMAEADPMNRLAASVGVGGAGTPAQPVPAVPGAPGGLLDRLGGSPTDGRTP